MDGEFAEAARPGWSHYDGLGLRWNGGDGLVWIEPAGDGVRLEVGRGLFDVDALREVAAQMLAVAAAIDASR